MAPNMDRPACHSKSLDNEYLSFHEMEWSVEAANHRHIHKRGCWGPDPLRNLVSGGLHVKDSLVETCPLCGGNDEYVV